MALSLAVLVEEFRVLDQLRRAGGLALGQAARYRELYEELSYRLTTGHVLKEDARESLRVPSPAPVSFRRGDELMSGVAFDIGQGGLFLSDDTRVHVGELLIIETISIGDRVFALNTSAEVVWRRESDPGPGAGVRFLPRRDAEREAIDRAFFCVLELHLANTSNP